MVKLKETIFLLINLIIINKEINCQLSPIISHISPDKTVNIGDAVDLRCSVEHAGNYPVSWVKINTEDPSKSLIISSHSLSSISDNRYSIRHDEESSTYTLQITKIQDIDAGKYQCQVNIGISSVISQSLNLYVNVQPVISDNSTRRIIASIGSKISLSCYATGKPTPSIMWRRENNDILPTGNAVYLGNVLTIHNVTIEDRGIYYCIAKNNVGKDAKSNYFIEVEFAPIINVLKKEHFQAEDYPADLSCQVSAFPVPIIFWYKDLIQIYENDDYKIVQSAGDNFIESNLRINSIRRSQYGTYTCRASNRLGSNKQDIELKYSRVPVCPPACGVSGAFIFSLNFNLILITLFFTLKNHV